MITLQEDFVGGKSVSIEEQSALLIKKAKASLVGISDIEDLFSLVATSYIAIESLLVEIGISSAYNPPQDRDQVEEAFRTATENMNLKLLTLLTAFKSYEDHLPQRLVELGDSEGTIATEDKTASNHAFDSSVGYKVFTGLRNHVQHSRLPLKGITFGITNQLQNRKDAANTKSRGRHTVNPYLSVEDLLASKKLNGKVRAELETIAQPKIDLKWLIREFICRFAERHYSLRQHLAPILEASSSVYEQTYANASKHFDYEAKHLTIVYSGESRTHREYIKKDLGDHTRLISERYSSFKPVPRIFMSNEVVASKDTFTGSDPDVWITE